MGRPRNALAEKLIDKTIVIQVDGRHDLFYRRVAGVDCDPDPLSPQAEMRIVLGEEIEEPEIFPGRAKCILFRLGDEGADAWAGHLEGQGLETVFWLTP